MFSLSKLSLQSKKNSKINISDFQNGTNFSMLTIYESSLSSDTGNFIFIQQNYTDGNIKIKKLIWISESVVISFAINTQCDWLAVSLRGGDICILPLGALMGRAQKKGENWKTNDVTYLANKLKPDSPINCMKWWTTSKKKNTCLLGTVNGTFLIVDLSNGSLLYSQKYFDDIRSIDLLFSSDGSFSYVIVTTKDFVQWKLLLEEVNNKEPMFDKEFGFEELDFPVIHSSSILESRSVKKSKGDKSANPIYVPTKLYQFSESTYLKSQTYNGKYFIGAYDKMTGKYKLFDSSNLDSSLYEFQLPLNVVDICVTEELIFFIVEFLHELRPSDAGLVSVFHEKKSLKLCIICRQYAQNHLFEKYKKKQNTASNIGTGFFKSSISEMAPKMLLKCVLFEFELPNLCYPEDVISMNHFPYFFNFGDSGNFISPEIHALSLKNRNWIDIIKQVRGKTSTAGMHKGNLKSKWSLEEMKEFNPLFLVGTNGISICHLSQCFEDKFIDCLLDNDTAMAEWLGASLRLDMNYLYQYTAQLLASGNAQLSPSVTKSKRTLILEFFDCGYTSVKDKLSCLTVFWSIEDCLAYSLTLLTQINNMSPIDRTVLSNSLIPMFGYVMSDPFEIVDGVQKKKNKYHEKFRRFVMNNCFFHDFKAAKIMFRFGLVDEAFFIAQEKGCVLDLFNFLMENNYNTNWPLCFDDETVRDKYGKSDRDFVLCNIGLMDLEIVARSDPTLIKLFGDFICQSFVKSIDSPTGVFSFEATTHLCRALNPYGSIIDALFHIYSCTMSNEFDSAKKEKDLTAVFEKTQFSSIESLTDTSTFSKTLKLRREIGPELMAFCLLVISRDNQIGELRDHIYFIQLHGLITSSGDRDSSVVDNDNLNDTVKSSSPSHDLLANDLFESTVGTFKPKRNLLSSCWLAHMKSQRLALRHDICISIPVFDIDLFEDDYQSIRTFRSPTLSHNPTFLSKKSRPNISEQRRQQRCQINILGFQKERTSRVLLLPKSIENGREIIRQIALGKQHVLILTDCGAVYGVGNNTHWQLGIEKSLIHETSIKRKHYRLNVINPQLVDLDLGKWDMVISVAAGDYHSGVIIVDTEDAEQRSHVATWGWGAHGQLGHGDIEDQRYPRRLVWPADVGHSVVVTQMAMGCYHSVLLTNKGDVYSFGNNTYGQLGRPGILKSTRPLLVDRISQNISNIDTKYFHTVCCNASNEIFVWGLDANLCHNQSKSHDEISTPVQIDTQHLLLNEKIIQISCGTGHTTILTESKQVYSFGVNMWGQLGIGNRKECNHLVEVKMPKPVDFISTDNGVTVGMHLGEKNSTILVWGRCSHPLIQENIKDLSTDTVKPQLLVEYQHHLTTNVIEQNCFGIDSLNNSGSTILNKHQLMIFFRNCSKYLDRDKLISVLNTMKEFDIIADFYLINDMVIESLFWRIKSLSARTTVDIMKEEHDVVREDVELVFQFYFKVAERGKNQSWTKAVLVMMIGYVRSQRLFWDVFERTCRPLIPRHVLVISKLLIKYSLDGELSSSFLRDVFLQITEVDNQESVVLPRVGSILLSSTDVQRFHELIKTGNSETVYEAADDHKVVFFAGCGHAAVLGRYREHQVKLFLDKLRKRQLNFSTQLINRLYGDSTILPDCLECLLDRI